MIKLNGEIVNINHFPDGTLLLKEEGSWCGSGAHEIEWYFENNEELVTLIFITKHLRSYDNTRPINLSLPYIPNARQDRAKTTEDVFTLKYFADIINDLNFHQVQVLDPHSPVSEALINNIMVRYPQIYINIVIKKISHDVSDLILFFPDAGASKRYADTFPNYKYVYGNKKREWETGKIICTEIVNPFDIDLKDKTILIIDDICSRGTTFVKSAEALQSYNVGNIYLWVTHCENTILDGEIFNSRLIKKVYTTNSIFTKKHEKIEVMQL